MTKDQAHAAITDAGIGWDSASERMVPAAGATPGWCNSKQCESLALAATRSGASAEDLGLAVAAQVDGDSSLLLAILSG